MLGVALNAKHGNNKYNCQCYRFDNVSMSEIKKGKAKQYVTSKAQLFSVINRWAALWQNDVSSDLLNQATQIIKI